IHAGTVFRDAPRRQVQNRGRRELFFFSSRRRHTRWPRDWSSDVCSSDLLKYAAHFEVLPEIRVNPPERLAIERPASSVEETDVDAMIENMRAQRPVFTPVDREARDTDRVVFDYKSRIGGKPFEGSDLTDVRIVLG